jgi:hypothetical protein
MNKVLPKAKMLQFAKTRKLASSPTCAQAASVRNVRPKPSSRAVQVQVRNSLSLVLLFFDSDEVLSAHPTPGSLHWSGFIEPHSAAQETDSRHLRNPDFCYTPPRLTGKKPPDTPRWAASQMQIYAGRNIHVSGRSVVTIQCFVTPDVRMTHARGA